MVAIYRNKTTLNKTQPPVIKFTKVRANISKPMKPLLKTFYEPYWTDKQLIKKSLDNGKILEGRLFFDKNDNKQQGFVRLDPIEMPKKDPTDTTEYLKMQDVKVWGLRNLNRAYHMDKVYIKFTNWIEWGNAGGKLTKDIDFDEYQKYWLYCQRKL